MSSPGGSATRGARARTIATVLAAVALLAMVVGPASRARAVSPFPSPPPGQDVYDHSRLRIANGSCAGTLQADGRPLGSDLPRNFHCVEDFKLTSRPAMPGEPDHSPAVADNPQELFGVKGSSTNLAWEVTTGRPDVTIGVVDSGIRWDEDRPNLVNKYALNQGELPVPNGTAKGRPLAEYDVNRDGTFDVRDYAGDGRIVENPLDQNSLVDPGDLIRTFSDTVDDDGNGYRDDISGWDFEEDDNDPNDDVDYGHGTGEAEDSAGETGIDIDPQCPNCRLVMLRVGESFVADVNHFAEAVVFATNSGVSLIQSALGTLNNTAFAQQAIDYAWSKGVLLVASAADESAGHHNMPSALNRSMVVNSVTDVELSGGVYAQPPTYLAFNGCTNYGGYIFASVPSTSCSSDAVAQASGMVGLVYSAGRNAVQAGTIGPNPRTGTALSAAEVKQLVRIGSEDIDFSSPKANPGSVPPFVAPPNNFATSIPDTVRFATTPGWDQISGYGRTNANLMVRAVAAGAIPPEADLTAPLWWSPSTPGQTVQVRGDAAALRRPGSSTFSWRVEYAPGVQPPLFPATDTWTTAGSGTGKGGTSVPVSVDIPHAVLRAALDSPTHVPPYTPLNDPTDRSLPERDAYRVRLVVTDDAGRTAVEQRQGFARASDEGALPGFPLQLGADGAGSPAFDDLDGDGVDELVIADGQGLLHAFKADRSEAPGFPVRTPRIPLPSSVTDVVGEVSGAVLAGTPTVADLDGDGEVEVAVADLEGNLSAWRHDGTPMPGFPVRSNPAYSVEVGCEETGAGRHCDDDGFTDATGRHVVRGDKFNGVSPAFTAQATAFDLDPAFPGKELVIGSNDGHVYAFHADGTAVPGWPVLLRDPQKLAAVDPLTHHLTYKAGSGAKFGRKVIAGVSIADVDGDGSPDIAANVNEEYEERANTSVFRDPAIAALGAAQPPGNTRTYLLWADGTNHPQTPASTASAHPDDQAYKPGWPVKVAYLTLELLPYVGEGSNGAAVIGNLDTDPALEIVTASAAGPVYALDPDGSSMFGNGPDGTYVTFATALAEFRNGSTTDGPSIPALGGAVIGRLTSAQALPNVAMGAAGLRRLLDVILPEQQLLTEDHVNAWDPTTGTFLPGFPAMMNDLQFFNTPAIADISGDGDAEVITSSATYDLRAYGLGGAVPPGWPKQTGGWAVATPGVGDLDGDGRLDVAIPTREGNVFVYGSEGDACQEIEWGGWQHDLANTGTHGVDAKRPAAVGGLTRVGQQLRFTAPGDDLRCGTATRYEVLVDGRPLGTATPAPGPSGSAQVLDLGPEVAEGADIVVRAVDEAGNVSPARAVGDEPASVVPEVGRGVLLPATALLLLGAAVALRRRRAGHRG